MSVVGIDLGTTNTVIACVRGGRVHVLADGEGHRLLPSIVSFHPNGDVLVGYPAKERRTVDARNTIASVKRLIGRSWKSEEIAKSRARFPFDMKEGPGHAPLIVSRGQEYTLPEISAFVLKRAKQIAEVALGEPVERAVITVPANFNELQRASTKVAGRVAGLDVLRILNEPTAAALAYGLGRGGHERIAVYDFGGGTFDCTLLDLSGNVFEVLATAGDSFLGGDDVDILIAERMAEAFLMQHRSDPRNDTQSYERLRILSEQVKIELSANERTQVTLRELAFGVGGAHLDVSFGLTRTELEALSEPLIERTFKVCQDALALAGLTVGAFDKVILVGGSTRIPLVRRRVEQFFGVPVMDRVNADEVVGIGAAIQAAALTDVARRRSIPAPPTGIGLGRSNTPKGPPGDAASGAVLGRVSLKSTQPMMAAAAMPRPVPPTPPPPPSRAAASSPLAAEEPTDITRQIRPLEVSPDSVHNAPTVPGPRAPMLPHSFLARTMPVITRPTEHTATTVPGEALASQLLSSMPDDLMETRPGQDEPTRSAARIPAPQVTQPMFPDSVTLATPPRVQPENPSQPTLPQSPPAPATSRLARSMQVEARRAPPPSPLPPPLPPAQQAQPSFSLPPGPFAAPVLIDVTPRALVVETVGHFCDSIIPRNAKIPCERTRIFSTGSDLQTSVRIRVAQGEGEQFAENTYLGELELLGLRPAPRGEVAVSVTFGVDSNGILQVRAADVATGREARAMLQLIGVAQEDAIAGMVERTANRRVNPKAS